MWIKLFSELSHEVRTVNKMGNTELPSKDRIRGRIASAKNKKKIKTR